MVKNLRFLLDEDLNPLAAKIGRRRGLDVLSVHEVDRLGFADEDQLQFATEEGRIFVTRNRDDYLRLAVSSYQSRVLHNGLVIVPQTEENLRPERIADALERWTVTAEVLDPGPSPARWEGVDPMATHVDLSIPDELHREISREAAARATTWSAMAAELLEEAIRMRRAPGVLFTDGPAGRRAVLAGTGLDVWELAASWNLMGRDFHRLRQTYIWLSEPQLRAGIAYYEAYPDEIDARLAREEQWPPETIADELPFIPPPRKR